MSELEFNVKKSLHCHWFRGLFLSCPFLFSSQCKHVGTSTRGTSAVPYIYDVGERKLPSVGAMDISHRGPESNGTHGLILNVDGRSSRQSHKVSASESSANGLLVESGACSGEACGGDVCEDVGSGVDEPCGNNSRTYSGVPCNLPESNDNQCTAGDNGRKFFQKITDLKSVQEFCGKGFKKVRENIGEFFTGLGTRMK